MKNIIWVDKCLSVVETAYADHFIDENVKIHPFDNYDSAFDFLLKSQGSIDLIVSGYCTFLWTDAFHQGINQDKICFSFYDNIVKSFPDSPFILYSSIAYIDSRTDIYSQKFEKFYSISKDNPEGVERIKEILFQDRTRSKTVNLSKHKKGSYKYLLKNFYSSIENSQIHLEKDQLKRSDFFKKCRGKFLEVLRNKNNIEASDIASKINHTTDDYLKIEGGTKELSDTDFFRICGYLGGTNEASIFLEKIEEAFKPEVKKARYEMAETLKSQFGIVFADSEKYEEAKQGQLINFKKRENK